MILAPFVMDSRLESDSLPVIDLALSRVCLMDDNRWPWLMLVPRQVGLREIADLDSPDRALLMEEICCVSQVMKELWTPGKLNLGALGNVVPQLHIHLVARYPGDPAWPKPVWGVGERQKYLASDANGLIMRLRNYLG